jgi:hypothetical protein
MQSLIWGSSAIRESSTRRRHPGGVGGFLGGGKDMGRCLTYLGQSLGFILSFRVGPRTNRLVGGNGLRKKRGQTSCGKKTDWAKARD